MDGSDTEKDNPAPLLRPTKPRAAQDIRRQLRISVGAQGADDTKAAAERAHVEEASEDQGPHANHADQDAPEGGTTPAQAEAGKKILGP